MPFHAVLFLFLFLATLLTLLFLPSLRASLTKTPQTPFVLASTTPRSQIATQTTTSRECSKISTQTLSSLQGTHQNITNTQFNLPFSNLQAPLPQSLSLTQINFLYILLITNSPRLTLNLNSNYRIQATIQLFRFLRRCQASRRDCLHLVHLPPWPPYIQNPIIFPAEPKQYKLQQNDTLPTTTTQCPSPFSTQFTPPPKSPPFGNLIGGGTQNCVSTIDTVLTHPQEHINHGFLFQGFSSDSQIALSIDENHSSSLNAGILLSSLHNVYSKSLNAKSTPSRIVDDISNFIRDKKLFQFSRQTNKSLFDFTTPNGLCGYLALYQCHKRSSKKFTKSRDSVPSPDLHVPSERQSFTTFLSNLANASANSDFKRAVCDVLIWIDNSYPPNSLSQSHPFYNFHDNWLHSSWLHTIPLSFEFSFFSDTASIPLFGTQPSNSYYTTLSYSNIFGTNYKYSITELKAICKKANHFQHSQNHYFLISSSRPRDEISRINEALQNLSENIYKYFSSSNLNSSCTHTQTNPESPTHSPPSQSPTTISGTSVSCSEQKTISLQTNLLDLRFDQHGHLITLPDSISFIPKKFIPKIRKLFNIVMESIIAYPHDNLNWKKFLLLPTVLFSLPKLNRTSILEIRLNLLLENDWSRFTFGSLGTSAHSNHRPPPGITSKDKDMQLQRINQRVQKFAAAGDISHVTKIIEQTQSSLSDDVTFHLLQQKHPPSTGPQSLAALSHHHEIIQPENSCESAFDITPNIVRKIIRSRPRLRSPGIDKMNFEILRTLAGYGNIDAPDENLFVSNLSKILVLILDDRISPDVFDHLRDNKLVGIQKHSASGQPDIRPIGMGTYLRKLCSLVFKRKLDFFNCNHFQDIQYGLAKNGCEVVLHSFRTSIEKFPHRDHFFADADNAFNRADRQSCFSEVSKHFPIIMPFLQRLYGQVSRGWFFARPVALPIDSCLGFHQGCVLASWLFCMGMDPFYKNISNILNDSGFIKCIIDDANISAPFEKMTEALSYIKTSGPKYGFHLKPSKGCYLLGRCGHLDEALRRKSVLVDKFGLDPNVILVHPDDDPSNSHLYGAKLLGSFVSPSEEFIDSHLLKKTEEFEESAENIKSKIFSSQIKFLCLRWSFGQKINYLQRTIPSPLINKTLAPRFSELKKEILEDILDRPHIDDRTWSLAQLSFSNCGIGLGNSEETSHIAYIASLYECFPKFANHLPNEELSSSSLPSLSSYSNSLNWLRKVTNSPDLSIDLISNTSKLQRLPLQKSISTHLKPLTAENVHRQYSTPPEIAWLTSLKSPETGMWLESCPKTSFHSINNNQFECALSLRLFLPQKTIIPLSMCSCSTENTPITLDPQGLHLCSGCYHDNVKNIIHNNLRDSIIYTLNHLGLQTVREPQNQFRAVY